MAHNVKIGNLGGRLTALVESRFFQWLFVLSCVALSVSFDTPLVISLLGNLLSLIIAYYLAFRKRILAQIFCPFSGKVFFIAGMFAFIAAGFYVPHFLEQFPAIQDNLSANPAHSIVYFLFLSTVPALLSFFYAFIAWFVHFASDMIKSSDPIERRFFTAVMFVAVVVITIIYYQTNCFYAPIGKDGNIIDFDVVYTSDSGNYYTTNVFGFIGARENDLRQPLFALFAMPFAVIATVCSWLFFFIPNSYAVFMQTIQIGLLFIAYILASRLLQLKGTSKICFFSALILTYPVLLFSLTWEQYIFALFWLLVYIDAICGGKQNFPLLFTAASGSLMVNSAVWLFTMTKDKKQLQRNYFNCVGCFFIFFVLAGRLATIKYIFLAFVFSGISLTFSDKLLQFINYISACWIKPQTVILSSFEHPYWGMCYHYSYQLAPVVSLNLLGLAILAAVFIGYALNYSNRFAQICAFWVVFCFCILCLFGWGTSENGLILYSLYFGWAYFCLVFLAIETLLQKLPAVKYTVYTACIAALAYINIPAMCDLIQFGIKYYPCP